MQGGVEQRRVDAEALGRLGLLVGQDDLGVDLLAVAPGSAQALEGGAVVEAVLGEALVEVVDLDRLGPLRRPGARVARRPRRLGSESVPLGVAGPLGRLLGSRSRGASGSRLAPPVLAGLADRDLDCTGALLGEDQRRLQGQLLDRLGADLLARRAARAREGGAGQEHGAADGVVGQPGVGLQGEAAGEESAPRRRRGSIAAPSSGCSAAA